MKANKMAQRVRETTTETENLGLISGTHTVEGEKQEASILLEIVLSSLHTNTYNHFLKLKTLLKCRE